MKRLAPRRRSQWKEKKKEKRKKNGENLCYRSLLLVDLRVWRSFALEKGKWTRAHHWINPPVEVSFYVSSLEPRNFPSCTRDRGCARLNRFNRYRTSAFQPCVKKRTTSLKHVSRFATRIVVLITTFGLLHPRDNSRTFHSSSRNSNRAERASKHRLNTPNTYECRYIFTWGRFPTISNLVVPLHRNRPASLRSA